MFVYLHETQKEAIIQEHLTSYNYNLIKYISLVGTFRNSTSREKNSAQHLTLLGKKIIVIKGNNR